MDINVSIVTRLPTAKVLSQHEKYCKILTIAERLASIASYILTRKFSYAVQCLEKIVKAWEQGQQVVILVVDAGCQDDENVSSCIGDDPYNKIVPDDDITANHN